MTVFITPSHGQPCAILRGFIAISGEWMLLCKEVVMGESSPHITMQCIPTFAVLWCSCRCQCAVAQLKPRQVNHSNLHDMANSII